MALYDRFGRLMYGSPSVPRDVLDYVVFEKHISDDAGRWRMHAKLKPQAKDTISEHNATPAPRTMLLKGPLPQAVSENDTSKDENDKQAKDYN